MTTFVVMPVRGNWHLTERVLGCLVDEPVRDVLVLDNGSEDDTLARLRSLQRSAPWKGRLRHASKPDASIYALWNYGFARARSRAGGCPWELLMLNNDIRLPLGWVRFLRNALLTQSHGSVWCTYPDYDAPWQDNVTEEFYELRETRGVTGDGGMFGPCFMLAGDLIPWRPLITDPSYEWWWGDNHLAECIEQEGGTQLRVVGLPIMHENEATARLYPELERAKLRDRGRWLTREARGARAINRRSE